MAREPFGPPGQPFAERLRDTRMQALFGYWRELVQEAGDRLPPYRGFDPLRVHDILPDMQVFERVGDGRFLWRLVGEAVADAIGTNNKGRFLADVVEPEHYEERRAQLARCLDVGLPFAARGLVSRPGTQRDLFKRLSVPFRGPDGTPSILINFVVLATSVAVDGLPEWGSADVIWAGPDDVD